jgi:hypothetical protein
MAYFHLDLAAERAELLRLKSELAALRVEIKFQRLLDAIKKYNASQPRVPAGTREGGQWAGGNASTRSRAAESPLEQSLDTASDQPPRSDLSALQEIANDPLIRSRIDEAWNASNPHGMTPQEHGFWISRNEVTGELFTRPSRILVLRPVSRQDLYRAMQSRSFTFIRIGQMLDLLQDQADRMLVSLQL